MKLSAVLLGPITIIATAQTTSTYIDPNTSIKFQAFIDPSGYLFGISLPPEPSADFIGQLVGTGTGWAGVSLGGAMPENLLIAAWSNGTGVISSFRRIG